MRPAAIFLLCLLFLAQGFARLQQSLCGTYRDRWREQLHLHRKAAPKRQVTSAAARAAPQASPDVGDIAILDDSGGVVARRNLFNLDQKTLQFSPVGGNTALYSFQIANASYDGSAASIGLSVPLRDDDSAPMNLQFAFPFYGRFYQQIFVNSDGNLTFQAGDSSTTERSLGNVAAGAPRIAPLYMDLMACACSPKPGGL